MGPSLVQGQVNPLSAITIESLADLGYVVDLSLADPYTVVTTAPPLAESETGVIRLVGDVPATKIAWVDADGRVVRVINR